MPRRRGPKYQGFQSEGSKVAFEASKRASLAAKDARLQARKPHVQAERERQAHLLRAHGEPSIEFVHETKKQPVEKQPEESEQQQEVQKIFIRQNGKLMYITPTRSPVRKTMESPAGSLEIVNVSDIALNIWERHRSRFTLEKNLGKGGQGATYLLRWRNSPKQRVIKLHTKRRNATYEARILTGIGSHARIVDFIELEHGVPSPKHSAIFLVYCSDGDLWDFKCRYHNRHEPVPEMMIWKALWQIAEAMAFLHWGFGTSDFEKYKPYGRAYSYVHIDVKSANVLLEKDHSSSDVFPNIRLADFGHCKKLYKKDFHKPQHDGTHIYRPPESVRAPCLGGPAQDMWGVGAVVHELALGGAPIDTYRGNHSLPIGHERDKTYPRMVSRIDIPPSERHDQWACDQKHEGKAATAPWGATYSKLLDYYMHRCLDFNAERRATALDIVESVGSLFQQLRACSKGDPVEFERLVKETPLPEFPTSTGP